MIGARTAKIMRMRMRTMIIKNRPAEKPPDKPKQAA